MKRIPVTIAAHGTAWVALAGFGLLACVAGGLAVGLGWPPPARAGLIAGACLVLWLTEWTPIWVPTLVLWAAVPILFIDLGPAFRPWAVVAWSIDPILALFFGGFSLAVAARRWECDTWLVTKVMRVSQGRPYLLIGLVAATTVGLSMWISNIAAAILVFGALRPVLDARDMPDNVRRALLMSVALSANIGGITTPIGSGPNGIAMAAAERSHTITFVDWMAFGMPLAAGLLIAVLLYTRLRFGASPAMTVAIRAHRPDTRPAQILLVIVGLTVTLWLTEPLHHVPAWCVALGATAALLVFGLLSPRDFRDIDWKTLLLIAGGIGIGALLNRSGSIALLTSYGSFHILSPPVALFAVCLLSATLSALMSNTGTVATLIPLAAAIDPSPSTAVLVAISASLGVPFVVSTPPNAMAVANGLPSRELLVPGFMLMLGGCILVATTGPWVLHLMGIP